MGVIIGIGLGCLEASVLIVWYGLRELLANWTRAAVIAAVVGLCVLLGPHDGTALAFWGLVALVPWRFAHRVSWERCVGSWARPAWRRWRVYDYHWRDLMEQLHFVRVRKFAPDVVPRIVSLRTTHPRGFPASSTDVLVVRTERTVEDFALQAQDFSHVLGARSCRAYSHPRVRGWVRRHAAVRLELAFGPDPLERTIPAFPIPERPKDVDLHAIPVGLTEHGDVWTLPVTMHMLIAGVTGAGKGSVLWMLIRGLLPLIQSGAVRLWGWDPKGGVELNIGRDLFYRYCDGSMQDHADMLADAVTVMHDKLRWIKSEDLRKIAVPTPERPLDLLVIDEFAQITAKHLDRELTKQIDSSMLQLVNMGRAPAVSIAGFLQSPTVETNRHRNEFPIKGALRLEGGRERIKLILGDDAYDMGARCDLIRPDQQGVGFFWLPDALEPVRVRAAYPTDEDIRAMARDYAPQP